MNSFEQWRGTLPATKLMQTGNCCRMSYEAGQESRQAEIDDLKAQLAKVQAVPQWISVEDKLPPENILVLAMSQTISNVFNVYNVMALDEFEESNITHWMPLPPAPEAQEANQ